MLETLARILSDVGLWLLVWVAVLVGFSALILRKTNTPPIPRPWVVRRGECPFCGNELFGTTQEYQRLHALEPLPSESPYLCTGCDRNTITNLLGRYRLGLTDD